LGIGIIENRRAVAQGVGLGETMQKFPVAKPYKYSISVTSKGIKKWNG